MDRPTRGGRYLLLGLVAGLLIGLAAAPYVPRASVVRARVTTMLTPSGEIASISIPGIQLDSRVIPVGREEVGGKLRREVADYAVGHHADSAAPGGGTNIVLSGHNNINGEVFRRLDELKPGDLVTLRARGGEEHRYSVTAVRTVLQDGASREQRAENARYMDPTATERLTLISCWPYKPWPEYRIIVIAEPADREGTGVGVRGD